MARLKRLCPAGIAQHIIQRGNNRQVCFCSEADLAAYAHWLIEYSRRFDVHIHAWVFMTNHVHLLVTPTTDAGISSMMQSLGRQYVRYFNQAYQRSGTLWEGRFKSCVVQSSHYLLQCYKYIELNLVRAGMVSDPAHFKWSSYQSNALGVPSKLLKAHKEYLQLGRSDEERCKFYRALFAEDIQHELIADIRNSVNKGLALGNKKFKDEIEMNLSRRVTSRKSGRKPKNRIDTGLILL